MTTPFTYQFGYSWPIAWGHLLPFALFGGLVVAGIRFGWRRWPVWAFGLLALWAAAGLVITHLVIRINLPQPLATERFLASGSGRVVDIGAGSGRATLGLLLARPNVTVTAVDIYEGYYGIDDNTPQRLMENARIAGVAGRVEATVGDARRLPLASETYDGAISVAAIDHLPRADIPLALTEAVRVIKPGGDFLLTIVNVDAWARLASPHALAHHRPPDRARWRAQLEDAGFQVVEEGTLPGALFFLSRKPANGT